MNWGHKITLAYVLFFIVIMYLVIRSFQQDIDLVSEDYYTQEIGYQDQIDKTSNADNLENSIEFKWAENGVLFTFPKAVAHVAYSGAIHFYRPSNSGSDVHVPIKANEDYTQFVSGESLVKGKYIVKLDWSDGQQSYYQELTLFVP